MTNTTATLFLISAIEQGGKLTSEQKCAISRMIQRWERAPDEHTRLLGGSAVVMVRYGNLWLGVETDGYTHS